jgi:hypothetical protein
MRLVISAISLMAVSGLVGAADGPSPAGLPRYKFTVGEELVYREDEHLMPQPGGNFNKPRPFREGDWHVWVVNENADGSRRLIIRDDLRLLETHSDTPVERFTNRVFAYCDVFPDGRVLPNDTLGSWGSFPHLIDPARSSSRCLRIARRSPKDGRGPCPAVPCRSAASESSNAQSIQRHARRAPS